ncbi:MAG: EthD family reductase [Gammaproteobacteria bacterium]|nr:MAG: EthD family reductase [Gammaproteobacteria bacterium]
MIAVTFCYRAEIEMDEDYYFNSHLPFARSAMSSLGIRRIEVRKAIGALDGSPARHQMLAALYFDSMDAFQDAMELPLCKQAIADISNYYGGMPDIQFSTVIWEI